MARRTNLISPLNLKLKILNADSASTVHYMPYGVTTLEMQIANVGKKRLFGSYGSLRPDNRESAEKTYVGHEDNGKDFLVVWGGGKKQGVEIKRENLTKRLFMQIIHTGSIKNSKITLWHNKYDKPVGVVHLTSANTSSDVSKMTLSREGDRAEISFEGNLIPDYYSRWFPPRPVEKRNVEYHAINVPPFKIRFQTAVESGVSSIGSDLKILMDGKKVAQIFGDWRYSWPHAELFTFLGDSKYLVLRVWLYWLHEKFSENPFLEYNRDEIVGRPDNAGPARRGFLEWLDIESPDMERFDFLLDVEKKQVIWIGTDLHYQEYWSSIDNTDCAMAGIAKGVGTLVRVLKTLTNRTNAPQADTNPCEILQDRLKNQNTEDFIFARVPDMSDDAVAKTLPPKDVTVLRAMGFTRKHVPYAKDGLIAANLLSNIVTG